MKKAFLIVLLSVGTCLSALAESNQANKTSVHPIQFDIAPVVLTGDSLGDVTAGLDYDFFYRRSNIRNIRLGEAESLIQIKLNGTVAIDEDLNKKGLISEGMAGFSLLGGRAQEHVFTPGMDVDSNRGAAKDIGNWGYIFAGIDARHEATQTFDDQNLAAGMELGYINPRDENIYSFIPSVVMAYEFVDRVASDIDTDNYSRFRIEASLKSSFGKQFFAKSALEPVGLRLDGRYYKSTGMTDRLESTGQDEITYFAAALTYSPNILVYKVRRPTFFVRLSDGRLPPNTDDETVVSVGVIVHFL